mmetsp:Transcript_25595/g.44123  ORF Transcript_25595/g.44123 Transcript_25595/m.44123 type:complete len:100 (+) Transcript_25595:2-301(+)
MPSQSTHPQGPPKSAEMQMPSQQSTDNVPTNPSPARPKRKCKITEEPADAPSEAHAEEEQRGTSRRRRDPAETEEAAAGFTDDFNILADPTNRSGAEQA